MRELEAVNLNRNYLDAWPFFVPTGDQHIISMTPAATMPPAYPAPRVATTSLLFLDVAEGPLLLAPEPKLDVAASPCVADALFLLG